MPKQVDTETGSVPESGNIWRMVGLDERRRSFPDAISAGFTMKVCHHAADQMDLTDDSMRVLLGLSRSTWRRRQNSGRLNTYESDRLYRMLVIYEAAVDLFEGQTSDARVWIKRPLPSLSNHCALDMAENTALFQHALTLIAQLEHGVIS